MGRSDLPAISARQATTGAPVTSNRNSVAPSQQPRSLRILLTVACLGLFAPAATLLALNPARQIDQYGHDTWTSQHGLPGEAVYQILQSRDGYLWLLTSGGLARFDGVRFVLMDSAIGTEPVRVMAMTRGGDLLIRTTSRTVVYRNGVFSDYRPMSPLPDGELESLFETRGQEVLIGSDDFVYLAGRDRLHLLGRQTAVVSSFLEDDTGTVWVGAARQLYRYSAGAISKSVDLPTTARTSSMEEDSEHRIFVGTSIGLFEMDRTGAAKEHPRLLPVDQKQISGQVNAVVSDRQGNLWVGTSASGLVRMRGDDSKSFGSIQGLTDNRVLSIFEDREGSLWVGTASGLDRFRDTTATTYTTREGLLADTTRAAISLSDGSIFIIVDGGGLAQLKDETITNTEMIGGLGRFFASTAFQDKTGSLWVATMGGIARYKDGKFNVYKDKRLINKFIPAIAEDDESQILASSDTLAYRLQNGQLKPFTIHGQMTPLSVPGNYAFAIHRDHSGTLWFGTVKGLFCFAPGRSPSDSRVTQINFPVTSIADDDHGTLWLGGRIPGLTSYRIADGRVTHFKKKDGFFDDYPTRVLFSADGDLWVSTPNGILRANRTDMDLFADGQISKVRTVTYGTADGLKTSEASQPSAQPGGARTTDGRLWFTTRKGLVVIDPLHILHNDLVPPVAIESVVVDDLTMPRTADFEVPPGENRIEIQYTALSLRVPDRVRFKYRLEGYDKDWVDAGSRRVAYYNSLPPGKYSFRVIAANDDGLWNYAGASIEFKLMPHFYQTGWFRSLCALAFVLVVIGAHRLNTRLLRHRAAELSRVVDERTAELRESQRHLEHVAFFDSLTSLPNRRMLAQEFRRLLAVSQRSDSRLWLLMIDLDQFKQVNDTLGHDAGDALLVEAAIRLKAAVRESDCVARLGGDEFAILLSENRDRFSIEVICRRIRDSFAPGFVYNGSNLRATPSIGIATYPDHGVTQDALFKSADLALYEAKRAGGNGWQWFQAGHEAIRALVN